MASHGRWTGGTPVSTVKNNQVRLSPIRGGSSSGETRAEEADRDARRRVEVDTCAAPMSRERREDSIQVTTSHTAS